MYIHKNSHALGDWMPPGPEGCPPGEMLFPDGLCKPMGSLQPRTQAPPTLTPRAVPPPKTLAPRAVTVVAMCPPGTLQVAGKCISPSLTPRAKQAVFACPPGKLLVAGKCITPSIVPRPGAARVVGVALAASLARRGFVSAANVGTTAAATTQALDRTGIWARGVSLAPRAAATAVQSQLVATGVLPTPTTQAQAAAQVAAVEESLVASSGTTVASKPSGRRVRVAFKIPVAILSAPAAKSAVAVLLASDALKTAHDSIGSMVEGIPPIGVQKHGALWMVDPAVQPTLRSILGAMTYNGTADSGTLSFVLGQLTGDGADQVDARIGSGMAALVDVNSLTTGMLKVTFTSDPAVVAMAASGTAPAQALMFDQPAELIAQAEALASGATIPAPAPPTGGGGGGTTTPTTPGAPSGAPTWLLPAAAGGVLIVGVLFFAARKKARPAAA